MRRLFGRFSGIGEATMKNLFALFTACLMGMWAVGCAPQAAPEGDTPAPAESGDGAAETEMGAPAEAGSTTGEAAPAEEPAPAEEEAAAPAEEEAAAPAEESTSEETSGETN